MIVSRLTVPTSQNFYRAYAVLQTRVSFIGVIT
nr:MAG TPA: hypothetical protein [Caudoviricetes sp.]